MTELAWRRRKRERAAIEQVERRHEELLRVILAGACIAAPRVPILDGHYVEDVPQLVTYVRGVLGEVRR